MPKNLFTQHILGTRVFFSLSIQEKVNIHHVFLSYLRRQQTSHLDLDLWECLRLLWESISASFVLCFFFRFFFSFFFFLVFLEDLESLSELDREPVSETSPLSALSSESDSSSDEEETSPVFIKQVKLSLEFI